MSSIAHAVRVAAVLVASAACASQAPAAGPSLTVSSGTVSATATYTAHPPRGRFQTATGLRLTVRGPGVARQTFTHARLRYESPFMVLDRRDLLHVRDLDGDGTAEVVLDSHWGGAHCCFQSRIAWLRPGAPAFHLLRVTWGDVPARLLDLDGDGSTELVGADERFAYGFGVSYAASVFAPRVWRLRDGRLRVATREYPGLLAGRVDPLWETYLDFRSRGVPVAGALGAYLATRIMLGQGEQAWRRVTTVEGSRNPRMLRAIRRDLAAWGYR